jgi:pseudomonalisin
MQLFLKICSLTAAAGLVASFCPRSLDRVPPIELKPHLAPVSRPVLARPTPVIDEKNAVTIPGNVHPLARPEFRISPVDPRARLDRMLLLLKPSPARHAALNELIAAQQNPASTLYHHWLTPAQYGQLFGAAPEDIAQVKAWLSGHGFMIEDVAPGRRVVVFAGSAAQVADTFHTGMNLYRIGGTLHVANSENPQIPAVLQSVVAGVVSLNDFRKRSEIASRKPLPASRSTPLSPQAVPSLRPGVAKPAAQPLFDSGGSHYLFPADFATIYDLNPVYSAGTTGTGASIAIAARSNIVPGDVTAFRSTAGLGPSQPEVIFAGFDPGLVAGDQEEATLDVEWSGAVAPSAAVKLVIAASTATTDGIDLAAEYMVDHALAPVVSVSYGGCEQEMGATELAFYNGLWEQAASQGMSVFVASGDSGAAGCSAGSDSSGSGAAVNGLCASPYATCVGGTELNEGSDPSRYWSAANGAQQNSATQYIPEVVWNESGLNGGAGLWASGGGASLVSTQPAWQSGMSGATAAAGMRAVPDVALSAAAHDGYILFENGSYVAVSGTSAASTAFAGMMALVVGRLGEGQGSANQRLYALKSAEIDPFHATLAGNNSVPGVAGFPANGAPFSLATGLGSVDGALLVDEWAAMVQVPSLALSVTPDAIVLNGGSVSLQLAAVTGGSFSGQIAFSVTGLPAGVTAGWSSGAVAIAAGASLTPVTLTLRSSARTIPGSYGITVAVTGGGLAAARRVTVTIPRPGRCRYGLLNSRCDTGMPVRGPVLHGPAN